jgi:hypothetical protein
MAVALAPTPIIAPGAAGELDERWIDRLADQWLESLDGEANDVLAKIGVFLASRRVGKNPESQKAWRDRIQRHFGDRLLAVNIIPVRGSLPNYSVDLLTVTQAFRSIEDMRRLREAGVKERATWIAGLRYTSSASGVGGVKKHGRFVAGVSKHALKAIIKRCNIHTVAELHAAIMTAWPTISKIETLTREVRRERRGGGWRIPIVLPTMGDELAIFVIGEPSEGDDPAHCFVKTAFSICFFNKQERENVLRLHAFLNENGLLELIAKKDQALNLLEGVWRL